MDNLANIIVNALFCYSIFFLLNYKFCVVSKWFVKDSFAYQLWSCSYCVTFWLIIIGWLLGICDWQDALPTAILSLGFDVLFKRFA